jgi:hypothetical protein
LGEVNNAFKPVGRRKVESLRKPYEVAEVNRFDSDSAGSLARELSLIVGACSFPNDQDMTPISRRTGSAGF